MSNETPPDPFGDLLTDLNSKLQTDTKQYGITADELMMLSNLSGEYITKRQAKRDKAREADAATVALNTVTKTAKPFVSNLRRRMNLHPEMTDEKRELYKLAQAGGSRTPTKLPDSAPLLRLDTGIRGRITIHAGPNPGNGRKNGKPKGAAAILIEQRDGAPTSTGEWKHLAQVTSSPYVHQLSSGTHTLTYRACYVDGKGNRGPWSDNATATIGG